MLVSGLMGAFGVFRMLASMRSRGRPPLWPMSDVEAREWWGMIGLCLLVFCETYWLLILINLFQRQDLSRTRKIIYLVLVALLNFPAALIYSLIYKSHQEPWIRKGQKSFLLGTLGFVFQGGFRLFSILISFVNGFKKPVIHPFDLYCEKEESVPTSGGASDVSLPDLGLYESSGMYPFFHRFYEGRSAVDSQRLVEHFSQRIYDRKPRYLSIPIGKRREERTRDGFFHLPFNFGLNQGYWGRNGGWEDMGLWIKDKTIHLIGFGHVASEHVTQEKMRMEFLRDFLWVEYSMLPLLEGDGISWVKGSLYQRTLGERIEATEKAVEADWLKLPEALIKIGTPEQWREYRVESAFDVEALSSHLQGYRPPNWPYPNLPNGYLATPFIGAYFHLQSSFEKGKPIFWEFTWDLRSREEGYGGEAAIWCLDRRIIIASYVQDACPWENRFFVFDNQLRWWLQKANISFQAGVLYQREGASGSQI